MLVSSGGLGREVHLLLRAASLPGADYVLPALDLAARWSGSAAGSAACSAASVCGPSGDVAVLARGFAELDNAGSRQAFLQTAAGGGRARRPARQREQPARARRRTAVADRVGRERHDHPRRARRAAHEAMPGSRFESASRAPGTCPRRTSPTASPPAHRLLRDDRARPAGPRPLAAAARSQAMTPSGCPHSTPHSSRWRAPARTCTSAGSSSFAPPEEGPRPPGFAELCDHIARRLARAPRYRQKLAPVPFGLHDRRGSTTRPSTRRAHLHGRPARPRRRSSTRYFDAAAPRPSAVGDVDAAS